MPKLNNLKSAILTRWRSLFIQWENLKGDFKVHMLHTCEFPSNEQHVENVHVMKNFSSLVWLVFVVYSKRNVGK